MGKTHEVDDESMSIASDAPVSNAFRFTLMRVARLVLTLACEVAVILLCIPAGMSAFLTAVWGACLILAVIGMAAASALAWINGTAMPVWTTFYMEGFGELNYRNDLIRFLALNPYIIFGISGAALVFFWGQALAFGLPYRYKNLPPGLSIVLCSACRKETPNEAACTHCDADRFVPFCTLKLLWLVNVGISSVWGMHDLFAGFSGMARK